MKSFNFRQKYLLAILLIASFIITDHFFTNQAIKKQKENAKLINNSGRLGLISQEIALKILTSDGKNAQIIQSQIDKFVSVKDELKHSQMPDNIKEMFKPDSDFCQSVKRYMTQARQFVISYDYENINYIAEHRKDVLKELDKLVTQYQIYSEKSLEEISQTRNLILIFLMFLIILELIFVFNPMYKEINNKIEELETVNNELEHNIKEKTRELQDKLNIIDEHVIISETDKKGLITHVSQAFCNISQYTKEELIGKPHNIVRHEDMPAEAFSQVWHTIKDGGTWRGEVKNRRKDGSYYWVYSTIAPKVIKGQIVGYMSMRLDITASKDIEELNKNLEKIVNNKTDKLNKLNKSLEEKVKEKTHEVFEMMKKERQKDKMMLQQSKMAIMGEMIAMIAHQWRQPLSAIKAIIQSIEFKNRLGKLTDEYLESETKKASHTIDHMSKTIDDFRNFFKTDKTETTTSVDELIHSALNFVEHSYHNNTIKVDLELKYKGTIQILSSEFMQVLMNILNNAKDALVDNNIPNRLVTITSKLEDNDIIIKIGDNAGGIPKDIINRVFDPYFSTKSKNGTGIGLYMSKTIIDDHIGGDLSVENGEDGAIFTIKLPYKSLDKNQKEAKENKAV
jgi:PAS domain S-box-containing protein